MVQPFNYMIPQADPFAGVMQGLKLGASMQEVEAARAQTQAQTALRVAQEQEIQAKLAAQNRLATAANSLMDKIKSGTATGVDFDQYILQAPKDSADVATRMWEGMSKSQQQNSMSFGMQAMAALGSKDPQIGIDMLEKRAEAERATNPAMAQAWETIAKLTKLDPANGVFIAGTTLRGLPGGKEAMDGWESLQRSRMEQEKFVPELNKAKAEAKKAEVELKYLDKEKEKALAKATSEADIKRVEAQYVERIQQANLRLTAAQTASQQATTRMTDAQLEDIKRKASQGPTPVFNQQLGGFVVAPSAQNPNGNFIPLNKAVDIKDQRSAVNALKAAGYDPETGEDRVSRLINLSTSGKIQAMTAAGLGAFNITTSGMKAINELAATANSIALEILDGKIGAGVSNADRDFIVGTLGDVANPQKTSEERLAGWLSAKNRMLVSGLLPPPPKSKARASGQVTPAPTAPTQPSLQNLSNDELLRQLGVTPARR